MTHGVCVFSARPISDSQMRALEWMVARSPDASQFAKQAIIWILRQTKLLTRNVRVFFPLDDVTQEIVDGVELMNSVHGTTHITTAFVLLGLKFRIVSGSSSDGPAGSGVEGACGGVWVSQRTLWDNEAIIVVPDMVAISRVDLSFDAILNSAFWDSTVQDS